MKIKGYKTIVEASKVFHRKVRTVRQWITDKKVKAVKFNNFIWLIPDEEVEKRLKELEKTEKVN